MDAIINKAFYTGTHKDSFRSGESAEIIGVKMVQPTKDHEVRPCYHIRFEDGAEDYAPMHDFGFYTITSK